MILIILQYECLAEGCAAKLQSRRARREHMLTDHHYPASFNFTKLLGCARQQPGSKTSKQKKNKLKKTAQQQQLGTAMLVDDDGSNAVPVHDPRVPTTLGFGRGRARFMLVPAPWRRVVNFSQYPCPDRMYRSQKAKAKSEPVRTCHKCGEQGHTRRSCPKNGHAASGMQADAAE